MTLAARFPFEAGGRLRSRFWTRAVRFLVVLADKGHLRYLTQLTLRAKGSISLTRLLLSARELAPLEGLGELVIDMEWSEQDMELLTAIAALPSLKALGLHARARLVDS